MLGVQTRGGILGVFGRKRVALKVSRIVGLSTLLGCKKNKRATPEWYQILWRVNTHVRARKQDRNDLSRSQSRSPRLSPNCRSALLGRNRICGEHGGGFFCVLPDTLRETEQGRSIGRVFQAWEP